MLAASAELITLGVLRILRREFGPRWCERKGVGKLRAELSKPVVVSLTGTGQEGSDRSEAADRLATFCRSCGKCRLGRG